MTIPRLKERLSREMGQALEVERNRLRGRVRSLASTVRTLGESHGVETYAGGDPTDVASDLAEQEFDLGLEQVEVEHLREVEAALKRLEASTYGVCEDCDTEIDPARLRVLPWTRRCLRCAQRRTVPFRLARSL